MNLPVTLQYAVDEEIVYVPASSMSNQISFMVSSGCEMFDMD